MKYLTIFLFACQGGINEKGFIFDEPSKKFSNDLSDLIDLMAEEWGRPQLKEDFNSIPINIVTFNKIVPCDGKHALGCTLNYMNVIIIRTRNADSLEETALPHELIHAYSCIVRQDCDTEHRHIPTWEAGERALAKWVAKKHEN